MGLDLYCLQQNTSDQSKNKLHSTYSYIHVVRYILTQMTLEYLKTIKFREPFEPEWSLKDYFTKSPHDIFQEEDVEYEEQEEDFEEHKNKLIDFLSESLIASSITYETNGILFPIKYSVWSEPPKFDLNYYMNEFGILGLKHFVNHSGSEGYLSYGECIDIMNLFSRIFVFKEKFISKEEYKGENIFFQDLIELFKTSVELKTCVVFG